MIGFEQEMNKKCSHVIRNRTLNNRIFVFTVHLVVETRCIFLCIYDKNDGDYL